MKALSVLSGIRKARAGSRQFFGARRRLVSRHARTVADASNTCEDRSANVSSMSKTLQDKNIELVRGMSTNFVAGRLDDVKIHVSDTMIMEVPKGLPYSGSHKGWSGYLAVATAMGEHFSEISFAPPEYMAGGDQVVVLTHLKGKTKAGRTVDTPLTEIWKVKGDKVEKITAFYFDTQGV